MKTRSNSTEECLVEVAIGFGLGILFLIILWGMNYAAWTTQ